MASLSVCAIALNESRLIWEMLESVHELADEIVIGLDSRTDDTTADIVRLYRGKVISFEWRDDFSYARNVTLEIATGDWILSIDADERLTPEGAAAIREVLTTAPAEPAGDAFTGLCFQMGQYDLAGRLLGVTRTAGRLFRRRPEIRYRGVVHEEPFWIPDPSRTTWALIGGVLAMSHVGYDPGVWVARGKQDRNVRLLERRIAENPDDEWAREKLALQRAVEGPWIHEPSKSTAAKTP